MKELKLKLPPVQTSWKGVGKGVKAERREIDAFFVSFHLENVVVVV